MNKIIALLRCSTDRQNLDSQRTELTDYILSLGYKKEQIIYVEKLGASAAKVDKDYLELLDRCYKEVEKGGVEAVAVWHINRIARNEKKGIEFKEFMIDHKVDIIIKEPTLRLFDPNGAVNAGMELAFSLFNTMSKQQAEELKEKSRRGRERNKQLGLFNGGRIRLGYELDENRKYVINPTTSRYVIEIYQMYSTGEWTFATLSKEFTQRGIKLNIHNIYQILETTLYWDGTKYPPIITKDLWEKVRSVRMTNADGADKQYKHHFFANRIMKCKCGYGYTVSSRRYECSDRENNTVEHSRQMSTRWVDGLLWGIAMKYETDFVLKSGEERESEIRKQIGILDDKITTAKKTTAKAETKRERARELYLEGDISKSEYQKRLVKISTEVKDVEDEISQWQAELLEFETMLNDVNDKPYSIERISKISDEFSNKDEKEMRRIVRRWISKVIVTDDSHLHIHIVDGTVYKCWYKNKARLHNFAKIYDWKGRWLPIRPIDRTDDGCKFGSIEDGNINDALALIEFLDKRTTTLYPEDF